MGKLENYVFDYSYNVLITVLTHWLEILTSAWVAKTSFTPIMSQKRLILRTAVIWIPNVNDYLIITYFLFLEKAKTLNEKELARNVRRVCLPRHVRDSQILQTFHVHMSLRFASTRCHIHGGNVLRICRKTSYRRYVCELLYQFHSDQTGKQSKLWLVYIESCSSQNMTRK